MKRINIGVDLFGKPFLCFTVPASSFNYVIGQVSTHEILFHLPSPKIGC